MFKLLHGKSEGTPQKGYPAILLDQILPVVVSGTVGLDVSVCF